MFILLLSIFSSHSPLQPYNHCLDITGLSPCFKPFSPTVATFILQRHPSIRSLPTSNSFVAPLPTRWNSNSTAWHPWISCCLSSQPLLTPMADLDYFGFVELKQTDECAMPLCSAALSKTEMPPSPHVAMQGLRFGNKTFGVNLYLLPPS